MLTLGDAPVELGRVIEKLIGKANWCTLTVILAYIDDDPSSS